MKRILVTRPQHTAKQTAQKLIELGYQPVVLPLSNIIALPVSEQKLPNVTAITVTSPNAIKHTPHHFISKFSTTPLYAVGQETALKAFQAGFLEVFANNQDAGSLGNLMCQKLASKTCIAYLCGRIRRPHLETLLKKHDHKIHIIETYDTLPIHYSDRDFLEIIQETPIDAVLVYSISAALRLRHFLERHLLGKFFATTSFFCLSQEICTQLLPSKNQKIYSAKKPNETSLLSLLKSFD